MAPVDIKNSNTEWVHRILNKSLSLLPSTFSEKGSTFIVSTKDKIISGAIAPFRTAVIIVLAHEYFFAIALSGNIFLKRGPACMIRYCQMNIVFHKESSEKYLSVYDLHEE